jgi:hypothetical protein
LQQFVVKHAAVLTSLCKMELNTAKSETTFP